MFEYNEGKNIVVVEWKNYSFNATLHHWIKLLDVARQITVSSTGGGGGGVTEIFCAQVMKLTDKDMSRKIIL